MTQEETIVQPFNSFLLDVGDGHQIYVEESGNPKGLPIINFHGGPGSQSKPKHRSKWDLDKFRVILFDQRNCGLSLPLAIDQPETMLTNTPLALVNDAEKIRKHLQIDTWHVTGASWGSTLALLYAMTFPEYTSSLILRSVFLAQSEEWAWMAEGAALVNPPAYQQCRDLFGNFFGIDLINKIAKGILEGPNEQSLLYTKAFLDMEHGLELLSEPPAENNSTESRSDKNIINSGLLYSHVIINHIFKNGWYMNSDAQSALQDKPFSIIHGACDLICPIKSAYEVKKSYPNAKLLIAKNAGHGVDLDNELRKLFDCELEKL